LSVAELSAAKIAIKLQQLGVKFLDSVYFVKITNYSFCSEYERKIE